MMSPTCTQMRSVLLGVVSLRSKAKMIPLLSAWFCVTNRLQDSLGASVPVQLVVALIVPGCGCTRGMLSIFTVLLLLVVSVMDWLKGTGFVTVPGHGRAASEVVESMNPVRFLMRTAFPRVLAPH